MKHRAIAANPESLLCCLLAAWWLLNLVQTAFTELANDEAYYWIFAQNLDWGYFDHPPMTALLIRLGNFIGGSLGVRFFTSILQPLYIYILWMLVRPPKASLRDVWLFFLISMAIPLMMLYGFIAVPDAPLMMFTALFLLCFKQFAAKNGKHSTLQTGWKETLLLGVCMAALVYSKYQAALVVIFAFAANYHLFGKLKTYLAGAVALALTVPHLAWQYQHDWVSVLYHLVERNSQFKFSYFSEYILNIIAVFNPLFFPLYLWGWKKTVSPIFHCHLNVSESKTANTSCAAHRAMYAITAGFIAFFLLSALRGHVQPQWIIPAAFGLIAILFNYSRQNLKLYKYVRNTAIITIALFALLRVEMVWNPLKIKFEIFDNAKSYTQIADISKGKPVIFRGGYAIASKYIYYTGNEAFSQTNIGNRASQWQFLDYDTHFAGRSVIVETSPENADNTVNLANGRQFSWTVIDNFYPVSKVKIEPVSAPSSFRDGEICMLNLNFVNPYKYDISISPTELPLTIVWGSKTVGIREFIIGNVSFTVPAGGKITKEIQISVPEDLSGVCTLGFSLKTAKIGNWFNSKKYSVEIVRD
ncbi:MAG: glycosyltransferase family 39 protein [Prevotellaceae bacterium]|nr:glycosyltransferase family 39 protein [Prevotellaceae bacterium]